jgi:hypothetical protein
MSTYREIDLSGVKGIPVANRVSKVRSAQLGHPVDPDATVERFLESLPDLLGAEGLKRLAARVASARNDDRHVLWMIGGHVVKCGVGPHIVDLIDRGLVTGIAMNGAAAIHDFEMAMWGHTSEDVEDVLGRGEFGMTEETARLMNGAVSEGASEGWGLGEALGRLLETENPKHPDVSVLLAAWRAKVPATVHVAFGTDVIHQHPSLDPAALGNATFTDFKVFAGCVAELEGGVVINAGSAVIMPEVFIKAYSIARNLGRNPGGLATANLDFIQHYRPTVNVLRRPVPPDGESFALTGHHEILIPLLACAIKMEARRKAGKRFEIK